MDFQMQVRAFDIMQDHSQLFDLQHDLNDVFLYSGNFAEFVKDIGYPDRGDCGSLQGG